MSIQLRSIKEKTFEKNLRRYRGYTVFTIDDKVFPVKKPTMAKKYFDLIRAKYNKVPLVTVIPNADTLILIMI